MNYYITTDQSTTDFTAYCIAGTFVSGTVAANSWNDFRGWGATGAYTPVYFTNGFSSAGISLNAYNADTFNAAGMDSLEVHCGTAVPVLVTIISGKDIAGSTPTDSENWQGQGITGANPPYLSITYTTGWSKTISGIASPASVLGVLKASIKSVSGVE